MKALSPTRPLPTGPLGQSLAVALLVLSLAAVYTLAIAPGIDFYQARKDALDDKALELARDQRLAAGLPALRAAAAAMASARATSPAEPLTFDATSDAVAEAMLQSQLQLSLADHGTLTATTSLAPQGSAGYRRIGIHAALNLPYPDLVALLTSLDGATPAVIVGGLEISAPAEAQTIGERGGPSPLDVTLDLYGFRKSDPVETAP